MAAVTADSSIYTNSDSENLARWQDNTVRVGVIGETEYIRELDLIIYYVECAGDSNRLPIPCTMNTTFGGVFNFEEFSGLGYKKGREQENQYVQTVYPGDHVIIAMVNGNSNEGIIISQIKHPGRKSKIKPEDGIAYKKEFNGLQTDINNEGEYKVTFRGCPTNYDKLLSEPDGSTLPDPEYDDNVGTSYYSFKKCGSYELSDNASDDLPQTFCIDKPKGTVDLVSGKVEMCFDKNAESTALKNKTTEITSTDELKVTTGGTDFKTTPNSYELNTTDIKTKGKWDQTGNTKITGNTDVTGNTMVEGNFDSVGITNLAGGTYPLVHNIYFTLGVGFAGVPVISAHIFGFTTQTKAT